MTALVVRLATLLGQAGAAATPDEVLDALWLLGAGPASRWPGRPPLPTEAQPWPAPDAPATGSQPADRPYAAGVRFYWRPAPPDTDRVVTTERVAAASGSATHRPGGPALPGVFRVGRALRPLRVRRPATNRTEVDELATAEQAAQLRRPVPVLRPPMVPWPDLAAVVDCSSPMEIWHDRLARLMLLFGRLGAFREIRPWQLYPDGPDGGEPVVFPGLTAQAGHGRPASSLADPTGRRLILVVTDGTGPCWRAPWQYPPLLRHWSTTNPVAVLSLVPPRMWPAGGLRARYGEVYSERPLQPNQTWSKWWAGSRDWHDATIPIADLEPRRLDKLAAVLSGAPRRVTTLLLNTDMDPGAAVPRAEEAPVVAVARSRSRIQPRAFELLTFLSAAPLLLGGLLNRFRGTVVADATDDDLAEVLHGGLIEPVTTIPGSGGTIVGYRFRDPAVRDELRGRLSSLQRLTIWFDLFRYAQDVLGWDHVYARNLLDHPDDRELLIRQAAPGNLRPSAPLPVTDGGLLRQTVAVLRRSGPRRGHLAICGEARPRRAATAREIARTGQAQGWLRTGHVEVAIAARLLEGPTADVYERAAGGLLLLERPHELRDSGNPRSRKAVRELITAMSRGDGEVTVAVSGEPAQIALLLDEYDELADLIPATGRLVLPESAADGAYRLVRGLLTGDRLTWTADADHAVWRALFDACVTAAPGAFEPDAVAWWAYDGLVRRWRARTGGDPTAAVGVEDVLTISPKDPS